MALELTKEDLRAVLVDLANRLVDDLKSISGVEVASMCLADAGAAEAAIKSIREAHRLVCSVAQLVKEHRHG